MLAAVHIHTELLVAAVAEAVSESVPEELQRSTPLDLPELGELQTVRHYTRLSSLNMAIDNTFYPLGSCTMKYNPRVNEVAANDPGFSQVHPLATAGESQGYLEVFWYSTTETTLGEMLTSMAAPLAVLAGMTIVFMTVARLLGRRWERI